MIAKSKLRELFARYGVKDNFFYMYMYNIFSYIVVTDFFAANIFYLCFTVNVLVNVQQTIGIENLVKRSLQTLGYRKGRQRQGGGVILSYRTGGEPVKSLGHESEL